MAKCRREEEEVEMGGRKDGEGKETLNKKRDFQEDKKRERRVGRGGGREGNRGRKKRNGN